MSLLQRNAPKQFTHLNIPFQDIETYHKDNKRYYKTPIGDLPSATSILKVLDDGGIEAWRKRVGAKKAEAIANDAATRGEALHLACEHYVNNDPRYKDIDGRIHTMFRNLKKHIDKWDNIHAQEIPLYSKELGCAGRVDLIGEYMGKLAVGDYKTSNLKIDLTLDWGRRKLFKYMLQCALYAFCYREMFGYKAEKLVVMVACEKDFSSQIFVEDAESYMLELKKVVALYRGEVAHSRFYYL